MNPLSELEQLEDLTRRLLSGAKVTVGILERGDAPPEALDDACARRRRQYRRFMAAHRRLAPRYMAFSRGEGLNPAQAERAAAIMDEVRRVGRQVLELDRRAAELLAVERDKAGADLQRLNQGRKVRNAYGRKRVKCWGPSRISRTG